MINEDGERDIIIECPRGLREHLDMAARVEKKTLYMKYPIVTDEDVKKNLKKLKKGKAVGPDDMKLELNKALNSSPAFIRAMKEATNDITEKKELLPEWKESNTVMLPKKAKPKVQELRPIAMTNVSYKLYMNMAIKDKIEEHIRENELMKETQSGFTEKGRIENKMMILKYCIDSSFKSKLPLYVVVIDFSKAYNSLKRENLIRVLKEYKVHANIIEILKNVYS